MRVNLETFKHVLPQARAWSLVANKQLRHFFIGLVDAPEDVQDYQDTVWADYLPQDTTKLTQWETQFGLLPSDASEQERRDALAAAWRALGGQSPRYLQDRLQEAGFDIYIYESFFRVDGELMTRQPWLYLDDGRFLDHIVTFGVMGDPSSQMGEPDALLKYQINYGPVITVVQMGEPLAQMGEPGVQMGAVRRLGDLFVDPLPAGADIPIEGDEAEWPYVLYWGGAPLMGQPTVGQVAKEREAEFKTLILKLAPAQQWHGLLVDFA